MGESDVVAPVPLDLLEVDKAAKHCGQTLQLGDLDRVNFKEPTDPLLRLPASIAF